jgi:hypothetical protein
MILVIITSGKARQGKEGKMSEEIKIEGWEEITREEYDELPSSEVGDFRDLCINKNHYFKKARKPIPHVFENDCYKIEVDEESIGITNKGDGECVAFDYDRSFPLLQKAMKDAEEVMKHE